MDTTGKVIRSLMSTHNMTVENLIERTKLTEASVRNTIYDRTTKIENIKKIAQALGVSLDVLFLVRKNDQLYESLVKASLEIVQKKLDEFKVSQISAFTLHGYIDKLYQQLVENNNLESAGSYLKGLMEGDLKFGIIKSTN